MGLLADIVGQKNQGVGAQCGLYPGEAWNEKLYLSKRKDFSHIFFCVIILNSSK